MAEKLPRPDQRRAIGSGAADLPAGPGVYIFENRDGQTLYVGKAINLKRRVSQYQGDMRQAHPRTRRMISQIANVRWIETESELHALLLEDRMIKDLKPAYNIKQSEYLKNKYIIVGPAPYPALRIASRAAARSAGAGRAFGPYPDRHYAAELLETLRQAFRVRSCTEEMPTRKCANRDLGLCVGPCRGRVSEASYRRLTARAVAFLEGDGAEIARRLRRQMERHGQNLEFEKAALARYRLQFCENFSERTVFVRQFKEKTLVIKERAAPERAAPERTASESAAPERTASERTAPERTASERTASERTASESAEPERAKPERAGKVYLFVKGELSGEYRTDVERARSSDEPDWILHDRANVVFAWLRQRRDIDVSWQ